MAVVSAPGREGTCWKRAALPINRFLFTNCHTYSNLLILILLWVERLRLPMHVSLLLYFRVDERRAPILLIFNFVLSRDA